MLTLNIPDTVRYQITSHGKGATLCLWELARTSEPSEPAFLFKINHRVASKEEAQKLLRRYLEGFRVEHFQAG
jgi:hypothetical protein